MIFYSKNLNADNKILNFLSTNWITRYTYPDSILAGVNICLYFPKYFGERFSILDRIGKGLGDMKEIVAK